jgi:lipopolysaccharide/colanic/teichoic acid biosynthesis glycosyltransferase
MSHSQTTMTHGTSSAYAAPAPAADLHVNGGAVALPAPIVPGVALEDRGRLGRAVSVGAKRAFDIVVSATALFLLLPFILVVAIVIRLDSKGPAFYRCRRVGRHGDDLVMLKFRKMRDDATGRKLTTDDDDRFTRVGIWLAKLKIDEIPQLWNVLRGDMSLVGPRPESNDFVAHFHDDYRLVLEAKPGIIGLSQIAFAEESRVLDDSDPVGHYLDRILPQKVRMDQMYAMRRSFRFDLRILFWATIAVLLRRQVAVHRDSGKMNLRRR